MLLEGLLWVFKGVLLFLISLLPTIPMAVPVDGAFSFLADFVPAIAAFLPFEIIYRIIMVQFTWWGFLLLYAFLEWAYQKIFGR